jgi:hypothetical protein
MNSLAVALAADSAATVSGGRGDKVYKSANKLFMLSECHPVGVMVYNNGTLLGVPWETIIKLFRRELASEELPTIADYSRKFLAFLDGNTRLFPESVQNTCFLDLIRTRFESLIREVQVALMTDIMQEAGGASLDDFLAETKRVVRRERDRMQVLSDCPCCSAELAKGLIGKASGQVNDIIRDVFQSLELDSETTTALYQLAGFYVSKEEITPETLSGLVIAGFGRDEHFPVMQSFEIGNVYGDRLKYVTRHDFHVDPLEQDKESCVEPFADAEMAQTFLSGINAKFQVRVLEETAHTVVGLVDGAIDAIGDLTPGQKESWKQRIGPAREAAMEELWDQLEHHRKTKHLEPIHNAIRNLPKDELAHVAASLVNLNSFQKRMSLDPETVGGPIDVAVISKGDGFVWIDRKHYFRPELNQHFLSRYRRAPHAETPR